MKLSHQHVLSNFFPSLAILKRPLNSAGFDWAENDILTKPTRFTGGNINRNKPEVSDDEQLGGFDDADIYSERPIPLALKNRAPLSRKPNVRKLSHVYRTLLHLGCIGYHDRFGCGRHHRS